MRQSPFELGFEKEFTFKCQQVREEKKMKHQVNPKNKAAELEEKKFHSRIKIDEF